MSGLTVLRTRSTWAGLVGVLLAALVVAANAEPHVKENHQDWTVVCDTPEHIGHEVCLIVQQRNMRDSNQPILRIEIGISMQNGDTFFIATAPLGIALAPGLQMQVDDGGTQRYPFGSCIPAGCVAGNNLTPEQITALKRGNEAKFTFSDTRGTPITVPISLNGFTAGINSLSN